MPLARETLLLLDVVVYLAVAYQNRVRVATFQRLVTARRVDDAQPAHRQGDVFIGEESLVVGTASDHRIVHALDGRAMSFGDAAGRNDAGDPAHLSTPCELVSSGGHRTTRPS